MDWKGTNHGWNSYFEKKVEQTRPNGTAKRMITSGNAAFVNELTKWTFQEKNVLKVVSHHHHKANETGQPDAYRVMDEMVNLEKRGSLTRSCWINVEYY